MNKNIIATIKEDYSAELIARERAKGTKQSAERAEIMEYHLSNRGNDNGYFGRIFELYTRRAASNRVNVARQHRADTFVKVERANGRTEYIAATVKTNGGRVEDLYGDNSERLAIVALCFSNSTGTRFLLPRIMTARRYLQILEECGAIKMTNGAHNERAVQPSNKAMYLALEKEMEFDPDLTYNATDLGLD